MKKINVDLGINSYDILISGDYLSRMPDMLISDFPGSSFFIITDDNIKLIYKQELNNLSDRLNAEILSVGHGECSKSFVTYERLCLEILSLGVKRRDVIIAFGGGVVGDIAGFVASSTLRGTNLVQIPTTLLAQVDSSVGGKNGINTEFGKNLVGSFYQPKKVIIDTDLLKTLPQRVVCDGMAEVIKYALIYSESLFNKLETLTVDEFFSRMPEIVFECCDIKRIVVEQDEKESGLRKILNFGHTFGHVIEKYFNYTVYTHGEAVAAGMYASLILGESAKITDKTISPRLKAVLEKYSLPVFIDGIDRESAKAIISKDKKNSAEGVDFVFIGEIAQPLVIKYSTDQIIDTVLGGID